MSARETAAGQERWPASPFPQRPPVVPPTPTTNRPPKPPTPRQARRAVATLARLGPDALARVAELLIDRLDAAEDTECDNHDDDAEPEAEGCCEAADDDPAQSWPRLGWHSPSRFAPSDASDDEHSLGWNLGHGEQLHGAEEGDDGTDLEDGDPAEEDDPQGDIRDDADHEPSVGWSAQGFDLEHDNCDLEPSRPGDSNHGFLDPADGHGLRGMLVCG